MRRLREWLDEASETPLDASGRSCEPAIMLERLLPLAAPAGITRIADVTGLDTIGVPVAMITRPRSRSLIVSQGKGLSVEAAQVSGLLESLESFHAERVSGPAWVGRAADLSEDHAIADLLGLPRLTSSRYRPELGLPWLEAFDLGCHQVCLVPLEIVSTDYTAPGPPGAGFFGRSTNGLATGATFSEAILHGLCEVIERDAWALLHASGGRTAGGVDLEAEAGPALAAVLDRIKAASCLVSVEEISTDIGVPVFFARLTGGAHGSPVTGAPAGGLGCHPSRPVALLRAVLEAVQSRLTRLAGARDDLSPADFRLGAPASRHDAWGSEPGPGPTAYGDAKNEQAQPRLSAVPPAHRPCAGAEHGSAEAALAWIGERLDAIGLRQRLVVDLSLERFRLPVVKVIVPGLEAPPDMGCEPGPRARVWQVPCPHAEQDGSAAGR